MPARGLVVVLDGLSFVVTETLNWFMGASGEWLRGLRRRMLLVTQPPNTFTVLNTFFTGAPLEGHGVCGHADALAGKRSRLPYLWERLPSSVRGSVLVHGVLVTVPPAYSPSSLMPAAWRDYAFLPRDGFGVVLASYLARAKTLLRRRWRLAIVWVPIPDQAHHHFFPAVTDQRLLNTMIQWYARALDAARELAEAAEAEELLIVSDHGLSSIVEDAPCGPHHHRDAATAGTIRSLPKSDLEVYEAVQSML